MLGIGVLSSFEAAGLASDSHAFSSYGKRLSSASFMFSVFKLQISTDRNRRLLVRRAAGKHVHLFEDTSHSSAMLRKLAAIVFYSDERNDFLCLLDGETYDQIIFTDILDRNPSMRDLVPVETRLSFREADL